MYPETQDRIVKAFFDGVLDITGGSMIGYGKVTNKVCLVHMEFTWEIGDKVFTKVITTVESRRPNLRDEVKEWAFKCMAEFRTPESQVSNRVPLECVRP